MTDPMRVLVTGGTGFLGSYLVADLLGRGHEVAVILRAGGDRSRIADLLRRVTIIEGDLENLAAMRGAIERFTPTTVAHLAWLGVGNADRNSPLQARNVPLTVDLAALAAEVRCSVFLGVGSQAEYGPYRRAISEADETHPTTLYGCAKLAACKMVEQFCAHKGIRFVWQRVFSTYGPADAPYWLIPSMIRTLSSGERMSLTRCEQQWGFLHARDAASAFRTALENENARGIYNLGSPDAPPLADTVTLLRDLVNPSAELGFGDVPYRPDQVMVLKANVDRLIALGWSPAIPLDHGLRETVEWYRAQPA